MTQQEYNPIRDYWESHWLAIRIKRDRGDDYFLKPSTDKDARLLHSLPKGVSDLSGQDRGASA